MVSTTSPAATHQPANPLRPFEARRDLERVADLIELGFQDTLDDSGRRYLQQMRRAARDYRSFGWLGMGTPFSQPPMSGYVWEENGLVVGNLSLIPYMAGLKRYFLIANVVVHPDFRRRGIGRHLTTRAITHAREHGAPEAWLHVRPENLVAIRLYETLGFIERTRRTTWQAAGDAPQRAAPPGITIKPRRRADWKSQRAWLENNYPQTMAWQFPFNINSLRPNPWGGLLQVFNNLQIDQWSAKRGQELLAAAALQAEPGEYDVLWLAAPAEADQAAIAALLAHARSRVPAGRQLTMDYPASQSMAILEQMGFKNQHTLIWMSVTL